MFESLFNLKNATMVLLHFEAEQNRNLHGDITKVHKTEKPFCDLWWNCLERIYFYCSEHRTPNVTVCCTFQEIRR
jgi:hypothetical protein